jgi:hypothetical protein
MHDEAANVRVLIRLREGLCHTPEHVDGEGVSLVGPIEFHEADRASLFIPNVFVAHA